MWGFHMSEGWRLYSKEGRQSGLKIAEEMEEAVNGRRPGIPVTFAQKNPYRQTNKNPMEKSRNSFLIS